MRNETTVPAKKRLQLILSHAVAAALAIAALPAIAGPAAQAGACLDKQKEDKLKAREIALLGATHAEEHAETRAHRCRLKLGLEKEEAAPARPSHAAAISPELAGQWSEPFTVPVAGITAVLLHTGKVLFWSYDPSHYEDPDNSTVGVSYLWDPATRTGAFLATPENIWCAGQTILDDGRVFIAGGNLRYRDPKAPHGQGGWMGETSTYTFNPLTSSFISQPEMQKGRWYPTVTRLADNTAIITSGYDETGSEQVNQLVERFTPSPAMSGVGTITTVSTKKTRGLYPFQYLLPSGRMLQAGPERANSWLLDPGTWGWTRLPNMLYDHSEYANGVIYTDASVSPVSQVVMIAGGKNIPANNEWLDTTNPSAGWRDYPKWNIQRHNANTVILPDGKLLTIGGNTRSNYQGTLFSAELYSGAADDINGAWIEVAPHSIPAAYHSSAILLPDGTVLLSEDDRDRPSDVAGRHRMQIYSPPYLFRGQRPTVSAPAEITRGNPFGITATTQAARFIVGAVLIAPSAVTHGNDMHQRFVKLPLSVKGGVITATVPASAALVPSGYYMLFVVDSQGVPSIARFVRVN